MHPNYSFAHFPATDGDMTVTLHVDPNDNPIPGQQANLYFLFDYARGNFSLTQCDCVVTITQQDKQILQQHLTQEHDSQPSIWGAHIPFIFPTNDVYHIVLRGKPVNGHDFKSFHLSWYFRVDPDGSAGLVVQKSSDVPILLAATILGTLFLIFMGWFIKKEIIDTEEKRTSS